MKTKKLFICAMCLLAAVLLLVSPALAAEAEDEAAWEAQDAAFLQDLGILWGTGNGLELDQELTRAQAATLCVRLLGGEADALANPRPSPFADVPSWAEPYVGWLYTQGVTVGTGDTTYTPNRPVTHREFCLFLTRALGGGVYDEPRREIRRYGAETEKEQLSPITRGMAARLCVQALRLGCYSDRIETLAGNLLRRGVFSEEAMLDAARNMTGGAEGALYSSSYGMLRASEYVFDNVKPWTSPDGSIWNVCSEGVWRDDVEKAVWLSRERCADLGMPLCASPGGAAYLTYEGKVLLLTPEGGASELLPYRFSPRFTLDRTTLEGFDGAVLRLSRMTVGRYPPIPVYSYVADADGVRCTACAYPDEASAAWLAGAIEAAGVDAETFLARQIAAEQAQLDAEMQGPA